MLRGKKKGKQKNNDKKSNSRNMQLLFSKLSKQRSSSDRFCHGSAQNQNLGANGITVMG